MFLDTFSDVKYLFIKAANCFRENKNLKQAAKCYINAAEINIKRDLKYEAECNYANAVKCYKL